MKIFVYRWDIFPYEDIIDTFKKQGHSVDVPAFSEINHLRDDAFEQELAGHLTAGEYDFVFSVNYFSTIARVCHACRVRYVSWNVDTPLISMQTDTVFYPENRIFTFDRKECLEFRQKGVQHIFHLPLAGNPERQWDTQAHAASLYPVSFVGTLYDKNRYEEMCRILPDYLCGYLDAAVEAQLHISCGNILSAMLSDSLFQEIKPYLRMEPGYEDYFPQEESKDALLKLQFNVRVLCHKAAASCRIRMLNTLAAKHSVHLFTTSDSSPLLHVNIHPPVDYRTEMPAIFHSSKINLNITSPNIESGIPLRVWDVLSAGGFLLTDYRPEYDGLLEDGRDVVLFDSLEDLSRKVSYYLNHEDERRQIAENGCERIRQEHNYLNRIEKMLRTI